MRRTAFLILLAGVIFVYFSIPFMGIDLLIDAVGFSLLFNAIRPLRKTRQGFAIADSLCLGLVLVSALQLLFFGIPSIVLASLRALLETLVFCMLAGGLWQMLKRDNAPRLALSIKIIFGLGALFSLSNGIILVAGIQIPAFYGFGAKLYYLMLILSTLLLAIMTGKFDNTAAAKNNP